MEGGLAVPLGLDRGGGSAGFSQPRGKLCEMLVRVCHTHVHTRTPSARSHEAATYPYHGFPKLAHRHHRLSTGVQAPEEVQDGDFVLVCVALGEAGDTKSLVTSVRTPTAVPCPTSDPYLLRPRPGRTARDASCLSVPPTLSRLSCRCTSQGRKDCSRGC